MLWSGCVPPKALYVKAFIPKVMLLEVILLEVLPCGRSLGLKADCGIQYFFSSLLVVLYYEFFAPLCTPANMYHPSKMPKDVVFSFYNLIALGISLC